MQNRRQRSYASYRTDSVRSVTHAKNTGMKKKPWLYGLGVLLVGLYFLNRPHEAPQQAATAEVKAAAVRVAASEKPVQAPFPTLNTKGFTATQQTMLRLMQEEYAKQPVSYDKTVLEYTEGARESWCADFISVVRFEARKPFENAETGYWRIPGVQSLRDYYASSNAYKLVGTYTPKFGDVAFYFGETPDGSNREHVAFVLEVRGDALVTLGGNETDKGIMQVRYDKLSEGVKGLAGFGVSSL